MAVNRGLGKGLSALFSDTDAEYKHSEMQSAETMTENFAAIPERVRSDGKPLSIAIEKIYANPNQPRKVFDPLALSELAESIREHGIIQPIVLSQPEQGRYMIVAGERRFRAAKLANLTEIPAYVNSFSKKEISEVSLIENLQRENLNAIEAASAIRQLMDGFNMTQEQVAKQIGKSRSAIANLLRLLSLPPEIISYVNQGILTEGHARALIGQDSGYSVMLAKHAAETGMTVREIETAVKKRSVIKKAGKTAPAAQAHSRELKDLIQTMQRVLGTKVSAVGSDTKGRIYIDYFSQDDLDRIFEIIEKVR